MSHPPHTEHASPPEVSEITAPDALVEYMRKNHGVDFLFSEDLTVSRDDPKRHTAILITPDQAQTITEPAKPSDLVWEYYQEVYQNGSVFTPKPNLISHDEILQCINKNPFRGIASSETEAVKLAYESWTSYKDSNTPDALAEESENHSAATKPLRRETDPRYIASDDPNKYRLQLYGRAFLKVIDFTGREADDTYTVVVVPQGLPSGLPETLPEDKEVFVYQEGKDIVVTTLSEEESMPLVQSSHILATSASTEERATAKAYNMWLDSQVYWAAPDNGIKH